MTVHSFKKSMAWYVTSESSPNEIWTVTLPGSHASVKAYVARDKRGYPHPELQDIDEIFDNWLEQWSAGRMKNSPTLPTVVGGAAGEAFPQIELAWEIWRHARGACWLLLNPGFPISFCHAHCIDLPSCEIWSDHRACVPSRRGVPSLSEMG